jgi:hypothetical protein
MSNILNLTIKRQWFDMIASGEKKEEYRELKTYWLRMFIDRSKYPSESHNEHKHIISDILFDINAGHDANKVIKSYYSSIKIFDLIKFVNGGNFHPKYPSILVESEGITIGKGNSNWGAENDKDYFVIKLGKILNKS